MFNYDIILKFFTTFLWIAVVFGLNKEFEVFNMTKFIENRKVAVLFDKKYGNYENLLIAENNIIVVSNGSEILKLDSHNLKVVANYKKSSTCNQNTCEINKINSIIHINELLWICMAVKYINNGNNVDEYPKCFLLKLSLLESSLLGNFNGATFTSSDFNHKTETLLVDNYIFNGFYSNDRKQLYISKNELPFNSKRLEPQKIFLPFDTIKTPGDFIYSFHYKESIYFLLKETNNLCGIKNPEYQTKLLKICDKDPGNQENKLFTTMKITLECFDNKAFNGRDYEYNYVFKEATSASWNELYETLVVSFAINIIHIKSSAICTYSHKEIIEKFSSKVLAWSSLSPSSSSFTTLKKCQENIMQNICSSYQLESLTNEQLIRIQAFTTNYPDRCTSLHTQSIYRSDDNTVITHITTTELPQIHTTSANSKTPEKLIIYAGTHSRQLIVLKSSGCVYRKFLLDRPVHLLHYNQQHRSVYIGTSNQLIKLSVDECNQYTTQNQCITDPYCAWSMLTNKCLFYNLAAQSSLTATSLVPPKSDCKSISSTIIQSKLRAWKPCQLKSVDSHLSSVIGSCQCKKVSIQHPIEISNNCILTGGLTPWSSWSSCRSICPSHTSTVVAMRYRHRSCSLPLPSNNFDASCGGLPLDQSELCNNAPACPSVKSMNSKFSVYSPWSLWTPCSSLCGFSYKTRQRSCTNPTSSSGLLCRSDLLVQKSLCLRLPNCSKIAKSEWTEWIQLKQYDPRRSLRFVCNHTLPQRLNPDIFSPMKLTVIKTPQSASAVSSNHINGSLSQWSEWSICSGCVSGAQSRRRICLDSNGCLGRLYEARLCNKTQCSVNQWSCWSVWTECPGNSTASCAEGQQLAGTNYHTRRTRSCVQGTINSGNCDTLALKSDPSLTTQSKQCPLIECKENYTPWSEWSQCNSKGYKKRDRSCIVGRTCLFPLIQISGCSLSSMDPIKVKYSSVYMLVTSLIGVLLGLIFGVVICYIFYRCTLSVIRKTESIKNINNSLTQYIASDLVDSTADPIYATQPRGLSYQHSYPMGTGQYYRSHRGYSSNGDLDGDFNQNNFTNPYEFSGSSSSYQIPILPSPPVPETDESITDNNPSANPYTNLYNLTNPTISPIYYYRNNRSHQTPTTTQWVDGRNIDNLPAPPPSQLPQLNLSLPQQQQQIKNHGT